jgi:protein-L-isoaspartate O-methyltransferase
MSREKAHADAGFLDMQADVGVTKHIGGFEATNELLSLCHIENAREVLNIGRGIGVGSAYVAKKYGCHVMGVDISDRMIEWSRRRAVYAPPLYSSTFKEQVRARTELVEVTDALTILPGMHLAQTRGITTAEAGVYL